MKNTKLQKMVSIGMLSSISFVLMIFNFPLPAFPSYLEVDFSDVPALIAAITMGPIAAIVVEFIKNILNWFYVGSPTGVPVGQIANFTTSILFIMPVYFVYKRLSTAKGLTTGLVMGTLTMAIGMSVLNYYLFMPMYNYFLNVPTETGAALTKTIVTFVLPFNIIKGMIVTAIMLLLFSSLKNWLIKQRKQFINE
ncbi:ECF transporter S component [Rummeliibacillus pycnus]|uniref:ECF transporter S component n=1 Tax=Rummeliibacillus pycnus TaxID=101070 RepID=UPI000C9A09D6|nr:ECF transporter S component [Rummeliibacillus pycnus]